MASKKVYCRDCRLEKNKDCGVGLTIESKYHGLQDYYIKGCGMEKIKYEDSPKIFRFWYERNIDNN